VETPNTSEYKKGCVSLVNGDREAGLQRQNMIIKKYMHQHPTAIAVDKQAS